MNMLISMHMVTNLGILLNTHKYLLQYLNMFTLTHSDMYRFT